ncbi:formate--tetrahydrofolate ligase [Tuanshanicoccus lijuaniae]|uniref:formate--tetrahydrofolate ligase n=1 Tax=Aerococcaceae bacterium zg-1292 TaxID=2774330 RepID=UPI001936E1C8|nr:formate--tetrahydrofolate ligase [Aerococcaceae bacterium zg-1292]MBS4455466.1 formate--tetrahydrofolate ligase [Aerococcaceae bacterium zg-A91]MBS4457085.1 formate--tetrahydrofolate ligase [Aerococcaceae bacterium zg-BR33]QQA37893.1 formate--tetrahydrofolate ligase [Aerococcaceae bacterium zg-1292]
MSHLTDLDIANQVPMARIETIAAKVGIAAEHLSHYGKYKAKIDFTKGPQKEKGKLILVTAITPTPAGEGKTTTSVGLADALSAIGEEAILALREPSLGPVFGMKGGAAGGGYAQVVPMEDINLHFTGDFHAIGAAHNLLAAMLDNHIHHGNALSIDTRSIVWKRVVDMNDRQLRHIVSGLNGKSNGVPREDGYDITVASEIMAILCLATDLMDLKSRIAKIIVAYDVDGKPVTAADLKAEGAMTALLKEAIQPNLVQTLEQTPAIVHGGPFANIAHGCNSVIATKTALRYADYVVTEAGFGADLGAEKFLDIKCRVADLKPSAAVLVATIRALKMHGGVAKTDLASENLEAVVAGLPNLQRHLANLQDVYQLPVVVVLNKFPTDTEAEVDLVIDTCRQRGVEVILSDVWAKGSQGGIELARKVVELAQQPSQLTFAYDLYQSLEAKLTAIVQRVYRGKSIQLSPRARRQMKQLKALGYDHLPICMAKTQYSFSDNAQLIGAPEDFEVTIKALRLSAGAGFIVALTGDIMTMPGLPKVPAAETIDIDAQGQIIGLF